MLNNQRTVDIPNTIRNTALKNTKAFIIYLTKLAFNLNRFELNASLLNKNSAVS